MKYFSGFFAVPFYQLETEVPSIAHFSEWELNEITERGLYFTVVCTP